MCSHPRHTDEIEVDTISIATTVRRPFTSNRAGIICALENNLGILVDSHDFCTAMQYKHLIANKATGLCYNSDLRIEKLKDGAVRHFDPKI